MNIISYRLQKCKIVSIFFKFYSDKFKKKDLECFMIMRIIKLK